jgi:predicted NAD/FAD-binding protein
VTDRSKTYVKNILSKISGEHFKNYPVKKIINTKSGIDLYYGGRSELFHYDKVVLATHADEALSIIENPTEEKKKILVNFSYKENYAYIHTDKTIMPKNKNAWCSWNSSMDKDVVEKNSITYWLNLLQNLKCEEDIFLTLNPHIEIEKSKILKKVWMGKPYFF